MNTSKAIKTTSFLPKFVFQITTYKTLLAFLLAFFLIISVWFGMQNLRLEMKIAFIVFGLSTIGWSLTEINDTYIALAAAIVLTIFGLSTPDELFATLGDSTIWLLIASFIVAAGFTKSGLSHRLVQMISKRAHTVKQLFFSTTVLLMTTAFFIPATSGRAALMLPLFEGISKELVSKRVIRALGLLFPTIILLSAGGSLIGAGAHLVTIEILASTGSQKIGFSQWLLWGFPFAVISCFASSWTITHIFLNRQERNQRINISPAETLQRLSLLPAPKFKRLSRKEIFTLTVIVALVILWLTESLHGIDNTLVAVFGALLLTMPAIGVITFKDAFKNIEWNMIIFMAATLKIGESLVKSGAAEWLIENLFAKANGTGVTSPLLIVSIVAFVSLIAHLFINSRTARSSVLIPLIVLLSVSLGYEPTSLAFLSTMAAGFCLTLPVSAKPVAMFSQIESIETYKPSDLLKLSSTLLPIHFVLLIIFAFTVWPQLGLPLYRQLANEPTQTSVQWTNLEPFKWAEISKADNKLKLNLYLPNKLADTENNK